MSSAKRLGEVYKHLKVDQVVTLIMHQRVAPGAREDLTIVEGFQYEISVVSDKFIAPREITDLAEMVTSATSKAKVKCRGIKFEDYNMIPKGQMHFWSVTIMDMDKTQYRLTKSNAPPLNF